jgi:quercetin dioxygenase-like cupin family protein
MSLNVNQAAISEAEWIDVVDPCLNFLARPAPGQDDYAVILSVLGPGVVIPLHGHDDRETMYVLSGIAEAYIGEGWQTLSKGDAIDIAGGVPHAWRNTSDAEAEILIVTTPRMERFFRDVCPAPPETPVPPTPEALKGLLETAQRCGYWIASPEENLEIGLPL